MIAETAVSRKECVQMEKLTVLVGVVIVMLTLIYLVMVIPDLILLAKIGGIVIAGRIVLFEIVFPFAALFVREEMEDC